jgi:hypothetical protein
MFPSNHSVQKGKDQLVWWCMPVTLALGRLRQKDHEFEASLGYMVRLCLKKKKKKEQTKATLKKNGVVELRGQKHLQISQTAISIG